MPHSEIENFDQFLNTLKGHGSVCTTHVMMLQDVDGEHHGRTEISETAMYLLQNQDALCLLSVVRLRQQK